MRRLVLCAVLGAYACEGGSGGNVELDNLGTEIGQTSCAKLFECCTDAELMEQFKDITFDGKPITTEDQCVAFTNAFFSGLVVASYKSSIQMGRVVYDGGAAGDCI